MPSSFLPSTGLLPTSALAVRVVFLAIFIGSIAQLAALVGRHASEAAWVSAVVYAIAGSSLLYQGQDMNTEQIALPLFILAADLADRAREPGRSARRALGLGAAAGASVAAATALKSIFFLPAAVVPLLVLWRRPGLLVAACAGGVVTAVAILVPFAVQGTLGELGASLFGYSADWVEAGWQTILDGGVSGVFSYLTTFPGIAFPVVAILLGALALRDSGLRRLALVAFTVTAAGWIAARAPAHSYDHYFLLCVPGLAVLIGLGSDALVRRAPGLRSTVAAVVLAPLLAVLTLGPIRDVISVPADLRWGLYLGGHLSRQGDAAEIVRSITAPGDRIYVATGGPTTNAGQAIYWEARRAPASRYIFPSDVVPSAYDQVAAELTANPPAAIVVMPGAPTWPLEGAIAGGGLVEVASLESADGTVLHVFGQPGEVTAGSLAQ